MRSNIPVLFLIPSFVDRSSCNPVKTSLDPRHEHLTDWEQIYNAINLYSVAVDFNETHELFPQIFAPDAFANYTSENGARSNLHGLQEIIDTFATDGEHYDAQHLLGSIRISFNKTDSQVASSTSEAMTTAFGRGRFVGQQAVFYGIYRDKWKYLHDVGWRISTRYYTPQGPASGNLSLLNGP